MCRLLAICGKPDTALYQETLGKFQILAKIGCVPAGDPAGHADGWGIAGYQDGMLAVLEKEPASAEKSPVFTETASLVSNGSYNLIVAHLRKASVGSNTLENTHPLTAGNISLCHNGTIFESKNIPLKNEGALKGSTDSERLLCYIKEIQSADPALTLRDAFEKAVTYIRENMKYRAMNLLCSDGKTLLVLRDHTIEGEYYTLYAGNTIEKNVTVICSEKLELPGITWRLMENRELLEIKL